MNLEALKIMTERSSVRKYKKGIPLPEETLNQILETAGKAPSSWNLQHWRFLVIQSQEQKEKILPIAYNQQQVVESSAVVVVLGDTEANKVAPEVFANAPQEARDTLLGNINAAYENGRELGEREAVLNGGLTAMQLMLAAKALGVDSCSMGGFDHAALVEALNIPDRYIPVMMITLGYAETPAHQTDRFPIERLTYHETFEEK